MKFIYISHQMNWGIRLHLFPLEKLISIRHDIEPDYLIIEYSKEKIETEMANIIYAESVIQDFLTFLENDQKIFHLILNDTLHEDQEDE